MIRNRFLVVFFLVVISLMAALSVSVAFAQGESGVLMQVPDKSGPVPVYPGPAMSTELKGMLQPGEQVLAGDKVPNSDPCLIFVTSTKQDLQGYVLCDGLKSVQVAQVTGTPVLRPTQEMAITPAATQSAPTTTPAPAVTATPGKVSGNIIPSLGQPNADDNKSRDSRWIKIDHASLDMKGVKAFGNDYPVAFTPVRDDLKLQTTGLGITETFDWRVLAEPKQVTHMQMTMAYIPGLGVVGSGSLCADIWMVSPVSFDTQPTGSNGFSPISMFEGTREAYTYKGQIADPKQLFRQTTANLREEYPATCGKAIEAWLFWEQPTAKLRIASAESAGYLRNPQLPPRAGYPGFLKKVRVITASAAPTDLALDPSKGEIMVLGFGSYLKTEKVGELSGQFGCFLYVGQNPKDKILELLSGKFEIFQVAPGTSTMAWAAEKYADLQENYPDTCAKGIDVVVYDPPATAQ